MAQFAQFLISGGFAQGVTHYQDRYPGEEYSARVVLPVTVEGCLSVPAIVDTGAPWCVIDPEIARRVGTAVRAGYEPAKRLMVRGTLYEGRLLRMGISLEAEQGDSLEIDATVFVPMLSPSDPWPHPNFVGLDGFLNRIRFAVDPGENAFYFGPV